VYVHHTQARISTWVLHVLDCVCASEVLLTDSCLSVSVCCGSVCVKNSGSLRSRCYDSCNRVINKTIVYSLGLIWSLQTFGFHIKEEHAWTVTNYMKVLRSQKFLRKSINSFSFMEPEG
jgi:hypothetical protein